MRFLYLVLAFEMGGFFFVYIKGPDGLLRIKQMSNENDNLRQEIQKLVAHLVVLSREINNWQSDLFYKEKFAREQLQMACSHDLVYYIQERQ